MFQERVYNFTYVVKIVLILGNLNLMWVVLRINILLIATVRLITVAHELLVLELNPWVGMLFTIS